MQHNQGDGAVPTDTVVHVLKTMSDMLKISVAFGDGTLTVIDGDVPDAYKLHDYVPRKLLHYFSRKYNVPIHFFYNPGMMHNNINNTVQ